MNIKTLIFIHRINLCIKECKAELKRISNGESREFTNEQIMQYVLPELHELKKRVQKNNLPEKQNRFLMSFAYAFKEWGCNMKNPSKLYVMVTRLNDKYKKL